MLAQRSSNLAGARAGQRAVPTQRVARLAHSDRVAVAVAAAAQDTDAGSESRQDAVLGRRALMAGLALAGCMQQQQQLVAGAEDAPSSSSYTDAIDKFDITPPSGWAFGEGKVGGGSGFSGATGARRTVAWFPEDRAARDVNITVVVTTVSVEFTKLGSFGNVDTFADNLINSLDRSYLLRQFKPPTDPVQIAKLVDTKSTTDTYSVEYTVQQLPGPQRHLLSKLQLGSNGRYNRLYTATAQCLEEDLPKYRQVFEAALASFKADVKPMV